MALETDPASFDARPNIDVNPFSVKVADRTTSLCLLFKAVNVFFIKFNAISGPSSLQTWPAHGT